ncbi:hypothetical protein HYW21_08675 [Candidatus Woesearchaeota archaeon]|nr:hypothetical protein [Candidatus Woesearchaeota archaeon]
MHKDFERLYQKNIEQTTKDIRKAITWDVHLIQAVKYLDELDKTSNLFAKRLREWYSFTLPELSRDISDHELFSSLILTKTREELMKSVHSNPEDSLGVPLPQTDMHEIMEIGKTIQYLYEKRKHLLEYIEKTMKHYCPNVLVLTGPTLGAKLIALAGGFRRLTIMPASTIQLLGAEKALFRHMKNKNSLPPKYGILHEHPLISQSKKKNHGKIARTLADKIAIAARVDYFHGSFIGNKLKEEIERKIAEITN